MAQKKELRIVYRKGTEEYADYLQSLLDGREDAEAELWSEREYLDCKRSMSEETYVVFLGEGIAYDQEGAPIAAQYEEYGMRCGWNGRRALISATERPLDSRRKIRAFLEMLQQQHPEIGPEELQTVADENALNWAESLKASVNPFSMVMESMFKKPVSSAGAITALGSLQYKAAVMEFYQNQIDAFLS